MTARALRPRTRAMLDAWQQALRSTERCDRPVAEAAVRHAHRVAGLPPPEAVVWMRSPLGGLLAATALRLAEGRSGNEDRRARTEVQRALRDAVLQDLLGRLHDGHPDLQEEMAEFPVCSHAVGLVLDPAVHGALDPLWVVPAAAGYLGGGVLPRSLAAQATARVRRAVVDDLRGQLGGGLDLRWEPLVEAARGGPAATAWCLGAHADAYDLAGAALAHAVLGWEAPRQLAATSAAIRAVGTWWPAGGAVVLCERPAVLHLDRQGRPHRTDGPAVLYADGWVGHALAGRWAPPASPPWR